MKNLVLITAFVGSCFFSNFANSQQSITNPQFSAFTSKNVLYLTFLADCNSYSAVLKVSDFCRADRLTKNLALFCPVDVGLVSTAMACLGNKLTPKVVEIDLTNQNIAPEANQLVLNFDGSIIKVDVNK